MSLISRLEKTACIPPATCGSEQKLSQNAQSGAVALHGETGMEISKSGWGGPRANSGGARPGAGRPANPPQRVIQSKPLGPRWYVVELTPGQELRIVRDLLEGEDRPGYIGRPPYRIEMPMIAVERIRRGVRMAEVVPMFGRYAFAHFDWRADDWMPLRTCPGVLQLFMTRTLVPLPLPPGFVEALIDTAADRLQLRATPGNVRKPGQVLRGVAGPLEGHTVQCVSCDGKTTVIKFHFMGADRTAEHPYDWYTVA